MRFGNILRVVTVGAASFVLALPALAQTTGTLSGQVVDANSQQPVGDAVVIAQSPALQGEQTAVTWRRKPSFSAIWSAFSVRMASVPEPTLPRPTMPTFTCRIRG